MPIDGQPEIGCAIPYSTDLAEALGGEIERNKVWSPTHEQRVGRRQRGQVVGPPGGSRSEILAAADIDHPDGITVLRLHQNPIAEHVTSEGTGRPGEVDLSERSSLEPIEDEQRRCRAGDVDPVSRWRKED